MEYGIYLPNYGAAVSARNLADLAKLAENSGWDGFFLWDHILGSVEQREPMVDPWIALTAMAAATQTIRLGTTVTPLARYRPWQLARATITLDHFSKGRLILGVGLGTPSDAEFEQFGEDPNPRQRALKLDEGLDILTGLWSGQSYSHQGTVYQMKETTFVPGSLQTPRIPIWVGGFWPNRAPFRRAARWDGVLPLTNDFTTPEDFTHILNYIRTQRNISASFDVVNIGVSVIPDAQGLTGAAKIARFAEVGVNWWLEGFYPMRVSLEELQAAIRRGPARI